MKGGVSLLPGMILVGFVLCAPLMGKSYRFRLAESARLYAIELQPGEYELKVFDEVAECNALSFTN